MVHHAARPSLAATFLFLSGATLGAVHAFTVAGIVKAAGMNGTNCVSDQVVMNGWSASTKVTLSFVPSGIR